MIASWKALLVAGITLALIALISLAGFIYSYGLTARGRPGVFETYAAHAIRSLALLRKKKTPVPIPVTDEGVGAGATQFTAMCSSCHGEYGRGMKVITMHLTLPFQSCNERKRNVLETRPCSRLFAMAYRLPECPPRI